MGDYQSFKEHLMKGNAEGVRNNLRGEFVDKIVHDFNGEFPIHVACRSGFVAVAKLLLDRNCNTECETKSGWRPIHHASCYGYSEIVKLLLDRNCNTECEDKSGNRPIHCASLLGHSEIVKLLLDRNCNIECEDKWGNRPIHWASRGGHTEIVKLLLDRNCNTECETESGNRPIHCASRQGHSEIVKLLLDRNCNTECETELGMRPIHWASRQGHTEIVKLLLERKCRIDSKTKDGETPLDIAKASNQKDCKELLIRAQQFAAIERDDVIAFNDLFESPKLIRQNLFTGLDLMDKAIDSNAYQIIKWILDGMIDDKEVKEVIKELTGKRFKNPNLINECILYLCIAHRNMEGFKLSISAEVINGQRRIVELPFLQLAAAQGCDLFIGLIIRKTIYDKSLWIKAIDAAKEKGYVEIQEEMQERMLLMESRKKVNFTILHTAISDNDADMVQYILNHPNIVDLNTNNETFGTALALAYSLHQRKCIRVLQQYQLDVNTRNKYSETPLHEAIASELEDKCGYLINRSIDIDQTGFMGLTGLHCAVIRGMVNVCAQLVNRGADCMRSVEIINQYSGKENAPAIPFAQSIISLTCTENALTLSMKFHGTLFPCFVDRLDLRSSNVHDGNNNSLLHLAVKCLKPDICSSLLNAGAHVNTLNNFGNSPLLEMLNDAQLVTNENNLNKSIEITKVLIGSGADVSAQLFNGITAFQLAANIGSEELMLALVSNNPKLVNFISIDFQLPFQNQWFAYAEALIKLLPDNFLSSNITRVIFHLCRAEHKLIQLLFDKSSPKLQQSILESLLYDAVNADENELFKHLVRTEISLPGQLETGETLLTFMIKENKFLFAKNLLKSINKKKFVNLKNRRNQSAVQLAIKADQLDLIDLLIHESEELDCEDTNGKSALGQLMEKLSISNNEHNHERLISAVKSAMRSGGDIYKITSNGRRILDSCTNMDAKAEIEEFHRRQPTNINPTGNEANTCTICMDKPLNMVFQCGHLCCSDCADQIFECHMCRIEILTKTKLFFN